MKKLIKSGISILILIITLFSNCKKDLPTKTIITRQPVAIAGDDKTVPAPIDSFLLDGSKSYDPDGTLLTYSWKIISGPGSTYISKPERAITHLVNVIAGVYSIELTVTNKLGAGLSAKDTFQLITNNNPVAHAGKDTIILYPANIALLEGSKSFDPDGTPLVFSWKIINYPTAAVFTYIKNPQDSTTQINELLPGKYSIELTVTKKSGAGLYAKDSVEINVIRAPVANAGADKIIQYPANTSTLDGSQSYDPDGTPLIFEWKTITGPGSAVIANTKSAVTNISNMLTGKFIFELSVTNWSGVGVTIKDTVQVTITGNNAPIAKAGNDITINHPASSATLDGSQSYDPDGSTLIYKWKSISGPGDPLILNPQNANTKITIIQAGIFQIELSVTNGSGSGITTRDTVNVFKTANSTPSAPIANAGNDLTIYLPAGLLLDGSKSYDVDKDIVAYEWAKIKGPASFKLTNPNSEKAFVTELVEGRYEFELTVTDSKGLNSKDIIAITTIATNSTANSIVFPHIEWTCPWECVLSIVNLNGYLPAISQIKKVLIKRDVTNIWEEVVHNYTEEKRFYWVTSSTDLMIVSNLESGDEKGFADVRIEF